MNGRKIEQYEIDYITKNYLTKTDVELSEVLNRSALTIRNIRHKQKLRYIGDCSKFTEEEFSFVNNNVNSMSDKEIGLALKRTSNSIALLRSRHKIKRSRVPKFYLTKRLLRMQELINICQTTNSRYKKDLAKEELKKLSGL